jgi:hypothetical protein
VFGEGLLDLGIEGFQAFVEGEDAAGKLGDDARGQSCPGSTIDWAFAAVIARAATSTEPRDVPIPQSARQAGLADAADPVGACVSGEQH